MPIYGGYCNKCGDFEQIFLTFEEAEKAGDILVCPRCGRKTNKNEFDLPARFSGYFGPAGSTTAPSKRFTYKKSSKSENPNSGSAA